MTPLRFRFWQKADPELEEPGEWLDIGEVLFTDNKLELSDDIVVMQSTGLKDKNGKEIFEEDVVGYWGEATWVVVWNQRGGRWSLGGDPRTNTLFALSESSIKGKSIIGNIYENPDLLKEE